MHNGHSGMPRLRMILLTGCCKIGHNLAHLYTVPARTCTSDLETTDSGLSMHSLPASTNKIDRNREGEGEGILHKHPSFHSSH